MFKYKINEVKFIKNFVLISFDGIKNVEDARKLIGEIVYVKRSDLKIKEGHVYIKDLIGVEIFDHEKKNIFYGKIVDVIKTVIEEKNREEAGM